MIIGIPEIVLLLSLFVLPIACLTNWVAAFKQMQAGEPMVPTEYVDNVNWGLADLGVIVLIVGFVAGVGVQLVASAIGIQNATLTEMMRPEDQGRVFMIFGTATLLATLLSLGWIWLRYGKPGVFNTGSFGVDLELGCRWFVMLVVPVLLLQLMLTTFFPSAHPLVEMLKATKNMSLLWVAAYAAMIAAPIFEEVFFRLFLQGWLEKLQVTMWRTKAGIGTKADSDAVILGGPSSASLIAEANQNPFRSPPGNGTAAHAIPEPKSESAQQFDADLADSDNPYEAPGDDQADDDVDVIEVEDRPVLWVPILVSSGLFALAHLQHGPDWIPLFFLALGLGYLYQRTRRIQPCIIVHMLVNGLGILQLWSAVRQP